MDERCRAILERAYLYLDHEVLSKAEREEFRSHLDECRPCLERYGLEQEVMTLMVRLRGQHPCPDQLKSRVVRLLEGA